MELSPDDTTAINTLGHIGLHKEAAGDLESARGIWAEILNTNRGNPHTALSEMHLGNNESI